LSQRVRMSLSALNVDVRLQQPALGTDGSPTVLIFPRTSGLGAQPSVPAAAPPPPPPGSSSNPFDDEPLSPPYVPSPHSPPTTPPPLSPPASPRSPSSAPPVLGADLRDWLASYDMMVFAPRLQDVGVLHVDMLRVADLSRYPDLRPLVFAQQLLQRDYDIL